LQPTGYGVRQPTNTWVVISETSVQTKAKQALRDAAKVQCARKQQQPTSYMMQGKATSTYRPQRSRSVDLEPILIEEIMRMLSGTMLYPPLFTFVAMLL
jgi:hypothetical protein